MNDLIRRQDAIDAFGLSEKTRKYNGDHSGYDTRMLYEIQDTLESLPSAQPEVLACGEGELSAQPEHSEGLYVDGFNDGYRDRMQDEPHWIPCSERLPDAEDVYIVCFDKKQLRENETQIADALWIDGKWQYGILESFEHKMPKYIIEPIKELTIIAWMPLPEPWRGEENG